MARALGFTRARVSQIMGLLLLAPNIQEEILFLEVPLDAQPIGERASGRAPLVVELGRAANSVGGAMRAALRS